jgi:hypothetical protein
VGTRKKQSEERLNRFPKGGLNATDILGTDAQEEAWMDHDLFLATPPAWVVCGISGALGHSRKVQKYATHKTRMGRMEQGYGNRTVSGCDGSGRASLTCSLGV